MLQGLGVTALAIDNRLVTNGTLASLFIGDPGITAAAVVPTVDVLGFLLVAVLLVLTSIPALRWRTAPARRPDPTKE
jgi:ABC-type Mn2+/Zn2+ transport system permease subunit